MAIVAIYNMVAAIPHFLQVAIVGVGLGLDAINLFWGHYLAFFLFSDVIIVCETDMA